MYICTWNALLTIATNAKDEYEGGWYQNKASDSFGVVCLNLLTLFFSLFF